MPTHIQTSGGVYIQSFKILTDKGKEYRFGNFREGYAQPAQKILGVNQVAMRLSSLHFRVYEGWIYHLQFGVKIDEAAAKAKLQRLVDTCAKRHSLSDRCNKYIENNCLKFAPESEQPKNCQNGLYIYISEVFQVEKCRNLRGMDFE